LGNLTQDHERWLEAGTYTLAVQGTGASSTSYGIRIITPQLTGTALTFGQEYTDAISEKGEWDTYTFTGTAGQLLYLDLINRGNAQTTRVSLTDEHGKVLFNRWVSDNDPDAFVLSYTGRYTLTFDGDGEKTDSYSFRLLDLSTASDITANIGKGGAISNVIYNGSAYKLSNAVGWEAAQAEAESIGGHLVTFSDIAENIFVNNNFPDRYYIGLTDKDVEGQWRWVTGEPLTYTNWSVGEPNGGRGENYAGMYGNPSDEWRGTWFDDDGAGYRGIIEASVTPIIINPGTNSGTLTDGRTTQIYKFNGTAGQAFVLTPVTAPANTTWTVYSPSGEVLVNGNANEIQTLGVKADGVYTLAIRGNAQATANFAFTVSEIKEGGVTSPPATAINFNQVYSGSLSSGQTVRFTFTGTAGQNLFYDAQGGDNVGLSLIDPFGRQVVSNANSTSDQRAGFTLTSDGVYTLVLGGVGAGTYRFQLMDLESGSNITLGNNFSGTFAAGGTSALAYRLEVTDTGFHYIDGQAGDGFVYVYRANGEQAAFVGSTNSDAEIWLEAGRYYLVYAGQGSANFTSKVLKSTVSHRGAISFYDQVNNTGVVSGTIANPTDQDVYTFTGQAGQILMFDALTSSEGLAYQIYSPSGKLLRNQSGGGSSSPLGISVNVDSLPNENMLLTESGTYTIRVVSGYTSGYGLDTAVTGNYQFRLFDVSNAQTASLDSTISGTVTARGSHVYRFNNPTRQYIYVDGQAGSGSWYIYGQDGALVNSHPLTYDRQFWLDAGEYYLVVQGDTDSTNNYSLRIETPSLVDFPTISYGQIVSGTIDELGEQHYYRFEGRAGDKIYFDSLGSSNAYVTVWFGDKNFRTIITDGYGGLYSDSDYQPSDTPWSSPTRGLTLLEDGTYYMTVDGYFDGYNNDNLGSYNFRLLNLNNAPVVNLDELISGTFTHGGLSAHAYRFNLTQRQYVFVDGQAGYGDWRIYRADGTKVAENYVAYNDQFWLDAGEYYLVVSGRAGGTNYSLQLVNTELRTITPAISFDTVVSDVISKKGQQHYYTFEGRAGQRLMFDGLGTTDNIFARITDPLGRLIMDDGGGWGVQTNADRFPNQGLTLEFDGVYTITIDGYDDHLLLRSGQVPTVFVC
jgi:hypothetical protein